MFEFSRCLLPLFAALLRACAYDTLGREVACTSLDAGARRACVTLPVRSLAAGVYGYQIRAAGHLAARGTFVVGP